VHQAVSVMLRVDGRKWSCHFSQPVQKSGCNFRLKKTKVHLIAKKKMPGVSWTDFEVLNKKKQLFTGQPW